jgi:acyl-homoserine-lactone acylase
MRLLFVVLFLAASAAACARMALSVSGRPLAQQVTIRRDTYGIPHILAESEEGAAFGFGYAQAEDHAIELAERLVSARGHEARYFGTRGVERDFALAQFDNYEESRRGLSQLSPSYRRMLAAFAAGVNLYVEQHRSELPAWIPAFVDVDLLASQRASAAESLGGAGLVRQLQRKYAASTTPEDPAAGADDPWLEQPGSNALAIHGSRTTTGRPILLGNPHLSWSSLYWEAHVTVPRVIDFYGSTLVGIPVLRAGFNRRLGFVQTNNAPDLDEVFALPLDPAKPDHYVLNGASHPLSKRDVTIDIRSDDGNLRQETRTFWYSSLGPVIYRSADKAFAVRSVRLEAFRYYEGFYVLAKARNLREFQAGLRRNYVPTSNFTYADADGNILYAWNARLPRRVDDGTDYSLDVPATSRYLWNAYHAVDDLPRLLNPRGGYVQNANNPPWFVSLRDPIEAGRFPRYVERGGLALRPQLALDMLEARERFSVQDVVDLKFNTRMLLAERVRPALVEALKSDDAAREGLAALETWDGRVAAGSRGAVLFQRFWDAYAGEVRQPYGVAWDPAKPASTPHGLANPAAAVKHFVTAIRATREAFGSESVAWGDVNRFRFGPIDLPGDGATGTYGTYRVVRFDALAGEKGRVAGNPRTDRQLVGFGDAWVLVVDFSGAVTGWSVLAYGQTTSLDSPHSRDQIGLFAAHKLRRAWFTAEEIAANTERSYRP